MTKALQLLSHFAPTRPEIGLSQLCRLAKRDKATTYRHLQALEDAGFVEQNPANKHYRLGPALLQLAHTREMTVPRKTGAEPVLKQLSEATGETAHVSVLSGTVLFSLASHESQSHGTRVIIDVQTFPLHATSSGLCALAFGPDSLRDFATANLTAHTAKTIVDAQKLAQEIQRVQQTGYAEALGAFETDVHSLSAPIFDRDGQFAGAISVAGVATRMTPDLVQNIKTQLIPASRQISHNWGGVTPAYLETIWENAGLTPRELETTS